jgi:MFS family permease
MKKPDPIHNAERTGAMPHGLSLAWAVLSRYRDFRWLFTGNAVSLFGSSVTTVALPLTAVVYLHASPAQMGVLGAAALLPHLVLGLPAGVWAGRMPYRRTLVLADLAQMLLLGSVPILAALGVLRIWQLYAVAVLAGACGLFETVAAQSFTPRLVSRQQLLPANSTLMISRMAVGTAGAALGGILVSLLTAPVAIAADAGSFLLSGLCKARIRTPGLAVAENRPRGHLRAEILEGARTVFGHKIIRAATLAAAIGALAGQMQAVILVLYLVRGLGLTSALVGVVIAAGGGAGVLGALQAIRITERIGSGPAFITGMLLASSGGLVLAAASRPLWLALVILVIAQALRGAGPALFGVNQQTFRQALIPPAALSRANATWRFLVYGMQSIGAILGGFTGSALSLRATLIISSATMLLGVIVAYASPLRTLRELPARENDNRKRPAA